MTFRAKSSNAGERRRRWVMVNDDHWWRGLPFVVCTALFSCGCLQTQPGGGSTGVAAAFGFGSSRGGTVDDGGYAPAVAKPGRGGTVATAAAAADGPDVSNPIQAASSKQDAPEQAPPPRPQAAAAGGQTPAAGQPAKDAAANPGGPAAPGQPPGSHYHPEPALALKRPQPPGPAGPATLSPAGVPGIDPHARAVPTSVGGLLNLAPGESLAERAIDLNARLAASDADRQTLETRARELTAALEARDRALAQHSQDIHDAVEEVSRAREQVAAWRKELEDARSRLRSRELEDVQTLKAIITLLERLTEPPAPEGRREGATRAPEE